MSLSREIDLPPPVTLEQSPFLLDEDLLKSYIVFQNDALLEDTLSDNDFVELKETTPELIVPPCPAHFPPLSRYIGEFIKDKNQPNGNVSSHEGYFATYRGERFYVKKNKIDPNIPDSDKMPELEVACYMDYKIVEPDIVPAETFLLYDIDPVTKQPYLMGVASQLIPNFKPNRSDPLREEDLFLKALDNDFGHQRTILINTLHKLSEVETRSDETWWKWGKETVNYMSSSFTYLWSKDYKPAARYVKGTVDKCLKEPVTDKAITLLIPFLQNRKSYLPDLRVKLKKEFEAKKIDEKQYNDQSNLYDEENEILTTAIISASSFIKLKQEDETDILKLVNMARYVRKNGINIANKERYPNPDQTISADLPDGPFEMTVGDLRNFFTLEAEAKILVMRYTNYDNDTHNLNFGKNGTYDFDMSRWKKLRNFKDPNFFAWLAEKCKGIVPAFIKNFFGMSTNNDFEYTIEDIEPFPNIKAPLRYWPAHSAVDASQATLAPFYENFYRPEDVVPFQKLVTQPVFNDFLKYKTFLKNILVTDGMYRAGHALAMRDKVTFGDREDKLRKMMLPDFNDHSIQERQSLTDVILQAPSFQHFLVKYGDYAFAWIKEEYEEDKTRYAEKIKQGESDYGPLYDAIDTTKMEQSYHDFCQQAAEIKANSTRGLSRRFF
jgi:hypothetical protein